jgi:hypothetical protein
VLQEFFDCWAYGLNNATSFGIRNIGSSCRSAAHPGLSAMTHSDDKPVPAVGAYWIDEADYPAVLKVFDDGNTTPRTVQ